MDLLARKRLEPRHVVIEVTETSATDSLGPMLENLSRLRMRGCGLSIDDFGMGYSSMERLVGVPFTELKIDRSFVVNALTQPASRAMLEASVAAALRLGMVCVAEGVERRSEWDLVRGLGCHLAQGYFVARPMEPANFEHWALEKSAATA
jgi:EAL domain-containing protein (putative c-di-GMP-specific phosphodiesterase class I)